MLIFARFNFARFTIIPLKYTFGCCAWSIHKFHEMDTHLGFLLFFFLCQSVSYVSGRFFFVYFLSTLCFTLIASSTSCCFFFHCLCHYLWVASNCLPLLKLVPFTFVSNLGCWSIGFLFQLLFLFLVFWFFRYFDRNFVYVQHSQDYLDWKVFWWYLLYKKISVV